MCTPKWMELMTALLIQMLDDELPEKKIGCQTNAGISRD